LLTEYRREYTEFNESITREHYLHYSGQKTEYELERIYDRYSDLFTRQAIGDLQREYDGISPDFDNDRKGVRHLLTFAKENFLEAQTKQLTAEIAEHEATSHIYWEGREVPFHRSAILLRNEPDAGRRRQIYERRLRVIEGSNDLRTERLQKIYDSAADLGHKSYVEMCQDLYGVDYATLNEKWQAFLNATDEVYTIRVREQLLRELKVGLENAHRADVGSLMRLTRFDQYFPKDRLVEMYRETVSGLGIDIEKQKNIRIDSAERPQKNPRAFCAPVEVPAEVMLVILPSGGQTDYQTFLHEGGHAQHFGFASSSLRPEFRYSGDRALSEIYAFLLQYLITDAEWLRSVVGMPEPEEFVRLMLLDKLLLLRRYAGKLDYELKLHSSGNIPAGSRYYVDTLTQATLFQYEPEEFLADMDDGFYSADYLRAWAFEVMLRDYLRTKFGRTWWQSKRAGDLLKEIWNTGNRYRADEIIEQVGAGKLSTEPVTDEFIQGLR